MMHPTMGKTDATPDRRVAGATAVEPKDGWTPVSADEAARVVRALTQEPSAGDHPAGVPEGGRIGEPRPTVARQARAIAAGAAVFSVVLACEMALISGVPAQNVPTAALLSGQAPPHGHPSSPDGAARNPIQEQEQQMNRATVAAAAAGLIVAGESFAQSAAVQWRVAAGGNGHWYEIRRNPLGDGHWYFAEAKGSAEAHGAHLVIFSSVAESAALYALLDCAAIAGSTSVWVGLVQDRSASDYSEPNGGWRWVDGSPLTFNPWLSWEPSNACGWQQNAPQDWGAWVSWSGDGGLDDAGDPVPHCPDIVHHAVFEWSTDCNNDGVVDYGQCRDGSLPDYNSNNIPDCCEQGVPCSVGMYAVESRGSEGGNGHWYEVVPVRRYWADADAFARTRGGDLASLTSAAEDQLARRISSRVDWPWVGGFLDCTGVSGCCSGCAWRWTTGEPFSFTNWRPSEPNQAGVTERIAVTQSGWVDLGGTGFQMPSIIEWSADCDSDGIVDYGQILRGERPDANTNGVPDGCECLADLNGDGVVQGADLGLMLAAWGSVPAGVAADINRDGAVDGNDLGLMLAGWGPCGG
jgi:hypothetical protein